MYSIDKNCNNSILINKSKFVSHMYKVNSIDEVNEIITNNKIEYNDATHCCYAYVLSNTSKYFDDLEPKNTAGKPMLNVLLKNNLINVLIISNRYFGGVKLGRGGLVRAYSKSASELLKIVNKIELIKGKRIELSFDYNIEKDIINIIGNIDIKKSCANIINYIIDVTDEVYEKLLNINVNIKIIEEIYIEKPITK